ncbi:hypothetical protein GPROT1_03612 [Gammaproteobacteria bacterium]|nr:hypothetical protein GPROT1_03612 [Gammaproteobacteria bacterium]
MPHFEEFYSKNKDKGLRMFAIEGDGLTRAENIAFAGEWKLSFPIVTLADSQVSQWDCKTMPNTFVIDAAGKLIFKASEGWDDIVTKELAKRPYPGIDKDKVEKECEKAAQAYAKGELGKAEELANGVLAAKPGEKAEADAQLILDAIKKSADTMRAAADAAKGEKRYDIVLAMLDKLAAAYKGTSVGEETAEEARSLRADKEVKKELCAWQTLQKTLQGNKACKTKSEKTKNLRALQKSLEGTAAAAQAREIATAIEGSKLYK